MKPILLKTLALILLAAPPAVRAADAPSPDRPNILWITSEDNGQFLRCYGDKVARTPNLDKLAARGVRFTNAFANAPVCAVARSSLIMGFAAPSAGMQHHRSKYRVPASLPTYVADLRKAGYYTSNNYKTDYNTSSFNTTIWDESGRKATYLNRPPGQPFFAVFNIMISHESLIFESFYPKRFANPESISPDLPIPPYQVRTPENLKDWQRMYDRIHDMDTMVGGVLRDLDKSGEAENTIVVYYADHSGITLRSKRYLYDSGTRVPLIVYVPEKWKKWAVGEAGTASDRLVQFLDLPKTALAIAGATLPDTMTGTIFMGPQAEPAPETVFLFSNRMDEAPDMRRGLTDGRWKYIRNYEPDRPRFQMLRFPWGQSGQVSQWREFQAGRTTPEQSAIFQAQPPEELFDTASDRFEIKNLAGNEADAKKLAGMRATLDREILATRDLGFMPEPLMESIDNAGKETIYEWGQSNENYPLAKILPLANLASARNPAKLPALTAALEDKNPIIRYWGALGLRVLGPQAKPAEGAIKKAMADPDDSTRITATIAYGKLGKTERDEALAQLVQEAKKAQHDIQALWALDGLKLLDAPEAVKGLTAAEVTKGGESESAFAHLQGGGSTFRPAKREKTAPGEEL